MYLIGIDPSSQKGNNGLAIWDTYSKTYLTIRSMSLQSIVGEVSDFLDSYGVRSENGKTWKNVVAVVENAELDSPVFGAWELFKQLLLKKAKQPFSFWEGAAKSAFRKAMAQAQSIGMLKIACRIIIEGLEKLGVSIIQVAPSWRDSCETVNKKKSGFHTVNPQYMVMPTKTSSQDFQNLTGYTDRTNEHGRDAATLVFNKTVNVLINWVHHHMVTSKSVPKKLKEKYLKGNGYI